MHLLVYTTRTRASLSIHKHFCEACGVSLLVIGVSVSRVARVVGSLLHSDAVLVPETSGVFLRLPMLWQVFIGHALNMFLSES